MFLERWSFLSASENLKVFLDPHDRAYFWNALDQRVLKIDTNMGSDTNKDMDIYIGMDVDMDMVTVIDTDMDKALGPEHGHAH